MKFRGGRGCSNLAVPSFLPTSGRSAVGGVLELGPSAVPLRRAVLSSRSPGLLCALGISVSGRCSLRGSAQFSAERGPAGLEAHPGQGLDELDAAAGVPRAIGHSGTQPAVGCSLHNRPPLGPAERRFVARFGEERDRRYRKGGKMKGTGAGSSPSPQMSPRAGGRSATREDAAGARAQPPPRETPPSSERSAALCALASKNRRVQLAWSKRHAAQCSRSGKSGKPSSTPGDKGSTSQREHAVLCA